MKSRPPHKVLVLAAINLSLASGTVLAQAPSMAEVAKQRHDNFKAMGKAFKGAGDQLKTPAPDLAVIKAAAAQVKTYSIQLPAWFPKGSGTETDLKMDAKAIIWTDPKGFAAASQDFQTEAAKLAALTATSTDLAAIRAQFKATGHTCGACHDKYRVKDD